MGVVGKVPLSVDVQLVFHDVMVGGDAFQSAHVHPETVVMQEALYALLPGKFQIDWKNREGGFCGHM